ncbi:Type I Iterative PKS [Fusarium chlamydosporum]
MVSNVQNEPIAIVGTGCKLPGESSSPSKLWKFLQDPKDVLRKIPLSRYNADSFYHPDNKHHATINVTEAYMLSEDIGHFDAKFFNINPLEANTLDPQQRMLLETVYEATESAGLPLENLNGSNTAVYVGIMNVDYSSHLQRDPHLVPTYFGTGTARSILANRISYFFNWHGPSMAIDSACSSSLVAVHEAVKSLREGESDVAVAAGANLILTPEFYTAFSGWSMLSPGGRSRMWDSCADGYGRGEGIGVVVLKRLSDAVSNGDNIQSIIRETGVNQDGLTNGITLPSAQAQATLIRQTYSRAGLDPLNKTDRCQFIEAHGTGTPNGDPIEAEALYRAFFDGASVEGSEAIHVGSIKTVCGHTEGAAGIAAIIKASLSVQHGIIPPNMLLEKLNPDLEAYAKRLLITLDPKPWPALERGQPRRASVNNFGLGGTNSHAILESYEARPVTSDYYGAPVTTPFVFSATSKQSLAAIISAYLTWLRSSEALSVDLRSLSYTLYARRSQFPVRATFSATSIQTLCDKLEGDYQMIEDVNQVTDSPRILGIFTGQGAQWAGMGKSLFVSCVHVRNRIFAFQSILDSLPAADAPSWSIAQELLAAPGESEIAAAFAAGFITAEDAVRISYYRGLYAKLAQGTSGQKGAMMAVAMTWDGAQELCQSDQFKGRISVAATNSLASVTLSGDADAIDEAKDILDKNNTFSRLLQVGTAYHSHHMALPSTKYMSSLQNCKIQHLVGNGCQWFSSVYSGDVMPTNSRPRLSYWRDNMTRPVLFSEAVKRALDEPDPISLVLELGPHPALRGPAQQVFQETLGKPLPYSGLMSRGIDDLDAIADSLGFLWAHHRKNTINFSNYDSLVSGPNVPMPRLLTGLPSYAWDHERRFWFESRASRVHRLRADPFHNLLGIREADTSDQLRWRNSLRVDEIRWISGHRLQRQMVFPAAGYAVVGIEAAILLCQEREVGTIELQDLDINRAITFDDENDAVETLVTLSQIARTQHLITADYHFYAGHDPDADVLSLASRGRVRISLASNTLVERSAPAPNLIPVSNDMFYNALDNLGYTYDGAFRGLLDMQRSYNAGTGLVHNPPRDTNGPGSSLLVHPAMLDSAFQSSFLAMSCPGDGGLRRLHVPIHIRRVLVDRAACQHLLAKQCTLAFDTLVEDGLTPTMRADVHIFPNLGTTQKALIQIEGLQVAPLSAASPEEDRRIFSALEWDVTVPNGDLATLTDRFDNRQIGIATVAARATLYYLRHFTSTIAVDQVDKANPHHQHIFPFARHVLASVAKGTYSYLEKHWLQDSRESVYDMMAQYQDNVLIRMVKAVGESLPAAVRGETSLLEHMVEGGLLDRFYTEAPGIAETTKHLAHMVKQIIHRYPNMDIIELGAGTAGATKAIFNCTSSFRSYTFTDISSNFFERATESLSKWPECTSKLIFKRLDIETDIVNQGYAAHSYDLIVASAVLHITSSLEATMNNVRRLLKPGGWLVMLEPTSVDKGCPTVAFCFCGLPGWWLGVPDGRVLSPCLAPAEWDSILKKTSFSGVDAMTRIVDPLVSPCHVMATQALDDRILAIREPFESQPKQFNGVLVIFAASTAQSQERSASISTVLQPWYQKVIQVTSLDDAPLAETRITRHFINIAEIDDPIFHSLSAEKVHQLKGLFDTFTLGLWVTQGCREQQPFSNMAVGFGRSATIEMAHIQLQFLDLDYEQPISPAEIAAALLRLRLLDEYKTDRSSDMLYSIEPEVAYRGNHTIIPRLYHIQEANDRYNSSARSITLNQGTHVESTTLATTEATYVLTQGIEIQRPKDNILIRVQQATLKSINVLNTRLFLVIGSTDHQKTKIIALVEKHGPIVKAHPALCCACNIVPGHEAALLASIMGEFVIRSLSTGNPMTVIVHEPDVTMAWALAEQASDQELNLVFTSSVHPTAGVWRFIGHYVSDRQLQHMIPSNASVFIDCSPPESHCDLASRITRLMPVSCKCLKRDDLFGVESFMSADTLPVDLGKRLQIAVLHATSKLSTIESPIPFETVPVVQILGTLAVGRDPITIVDWAHASDLPVQLQPIDNNSIFEPNKTYILFGLTSALGQSLAQWMVQHGARYIVLTSRSPSIQPTWLMQVRSMGATVRVYSCDITNRASLESLNREIRHVMPDIKGVVNGAMVLIDTAVANLTLDIIETQIGPKVHGSSYLDEIFSSDDLDFFVLISSTSAVYGSRGQAVYVAANQFMTALALQRRARGQPGSVLCLGAVLGAGYIARQETDDAKKWTERTGNRWISERDVHVGFAEAVFASRPDSGEWFEILVGDRETITELGVETQWFENPKFLHYAQTQRKSLEQNTKAPQAVSTRARLLEVTTSEQVHEVVKGELHLLRGYYYYFADHLVQTP